MYSDLPEKRKQQEKQQNKQTKTKTNLIFCSISSTFYFFQRK